MEDNKELQEKLKSTFAELKEEVLKAINELRENLKESNKKHGPASDESEAVRTKFNTASEEYNSAIFNKDPKKLLELATKLIGDGTLVFDKSPLIDAENELKEAVEANEDKQKARIAKGPPITAVPEGGRRRRKSRKSRKSRRRRTLRK